MKHYHIKPRRSWFLFDVREWVEFFDLFFILIHRDIKLRYKQTALGIFWVVLQPLLTSIIFSVVFGKLVKMPSDGVPYLLFALVGILPWSVFSQSVLKASSSITSQTPLISKIYFPRMMLPAATVAASLVDFAINLVTVFCVASLYGSPPSLKLLLILPLTFFLFLFSLGISLLFSAANVFYRDFSIALPFMMQIWMYGSPLVYSASLVPAQWKTLYAMNPLSGFIDGFRWAFFRGGEFPWLSCSCSLFFSLGIVLIGMLIFHRVERKFADAI